MLFDHHDGGDTARAQDFPEPLVNSFMAALAGPDEPALAWCAFGPPRAAIYFPVWLDGDLPESLEASGPDGADVWQQTQDLLALTASGESHRLRLTESLERLQTTFEQDADAFLPQACQWKRQGEHVHLRNQATALMHKHVGLFEREYRQLRGIPEPAPVRIAEEEFVSFIS
jgi:hypothetical protein